MLARLRHGFTLLASVAAVVGAALFLLGTPIEVGPAATTGQAAGSTRSYIPVAPRAGLSRPVSFRIAVPGSGVVLTGTPTTGERAAVAATPTTVADYLDVQTLELSYDGALTLQLDTRGDLEGVPLTGTTAFDLIGRPFELNRTPALGMNFACQVSPTSDPKFYTLFVNGFPGNELVDVNIHQINGDDDFSGRLAPVATDPFGSGSVSFSFWSDNTKDWRVTGTARASRAQAATAFRTSVTACPTQTPLAFATPAISSGPDFLGNSSFDLRVARVNGVWQGSLLTWNGQRWVTVKTIDGWQASGNTIRMTASTGDLGVSGSCIQFGALSQRFPTAGPPTGKAMLLDQERGPLASFCLDPDSSSSVSTNPPGGGGIFVQAWSGCGGSDAGLVAPACSAAPLVAERAAAQTTATPSPPHLVGVSARGIPINSCSTPTTTATQCPPVGISIWIRPDGSASAQPYTGFGPFSWVVTTNPPIANGSETVAIFFEDYARVVPLRIIPIGLAENQALLQSYSGALLPQPPGIGLNAAGTGSYTYSTIPLANLYRHLACDLRGLFTFSQVPVTFYDTATANKFIVNVGLAYVPTYKCS